MLCNRRYTHFFPKNWEGKSTGFANYVSTCCSWRRVCREVCIWCKSEGASASRKARLLATDSSSTHDFIQQSTAGSPHGSSSRLQTSIVQRKINILKPTSRVSCYWRATPSVIIPKACCANSQSTRNSVHKHLHSPVISTSQLQTKVGKICFWDALPFTTPFLAEFCTKRVRNLRR